MPNVDQSTRSAALPSRRIPATAYLLTGCIAVIGSNSLVLGPIAPEVAQSLSASVPAVMAATGAFGIGTAASALFLARHIDRLGARRVLQLAFVLFVAALVLSSASLTPGMLVVGQLFAGLAAGVALPAIYTLAATIAPPGRESQTLGIVITGWTFSMVAGVSLSAVLADLVHWRAVYAAVALLAVVAIAGLSFSAYRDTPQSGPAPAPLTALSIPGVIPLLLACSAFMIAFYGVYAYLGDHLHNNLGRPLSANGLMALFYGIGFGGAAFLDGLIDHFGARRVLPLTFLAVACVYALFVIAAGSYPAILALVVAWGLFNHFGLNTLVMRLAAMDPARRGTIMGLNSTVTYLAVFAGTIGFGPIYTRFGFAALAATAAVLMLAAIFITAYERLPFSIQPTHRAKTID